MPEALKNYRDQSRLNWVSSSLPPAEQVQLGALQRIADATELMAKNYTDMQRNLDYYKAGYERRGKEIEKLKLSQRALKGVATKAKNRT
ncbi:hypothetical protein [Hymenobacter algoricola]|uniref:Uncharacterized protein n=1 Tax=Hymenobacter algoricola TaxID=486267 RepID=A0ABP7NB56_9BACT